MTTPERSNQIERERRKEPYRSGTSETGNGHRMRYSIEPVGTGPDRVEYFVVRVEDLTTGMTVAMSSAPEPDVDAEREFTLDFLLEQRR